MCQNARGSFWALVGCESHRGFSSALLLAVSLLDFALLPACEPATALKNFGARKRRRRRRRFFPPTQQTHTHNERELTRSCQTNGIKKREIANTTDDFIILGNKVMDAER